MVYLGEKGEMNCFSLAQIMVGGGTLCTSHGKTASSPSITDIFIGFAEAPAPPTLDLGRTGQTVNEWTEEHNLQLDVEKFTQTKCVIKMIVFNIW